MHRRGGGDDVTDDEKIALAMLNDEQVDVRLAATAGLCLTLIIGAMSDRMRADAFAVLTKVYCLDCGAKSDRCDCAEEPA